MWYAPVLIGLAGSFHCIGMCGPLAGLASNVHGHAWWKRFAYNGGRIFTYGVLGAIVSLVGTVASIAGVQPWVSGVMGVLLVVVGVAGMQVRTPSSLVKPMGMLASWVKKQFATLSATRSTYATVGMGMVNGLLPCGVTWLALGYSATLQRPIDGFVAMLLFGLGTLPAMLGFAGLLQHFTKRFKVSVQTIQTVLLIVSGFLLIARSFSHLPVVQGAVVVICE